MLFNNVSENYVETACYLFNRLDQERGIQQKALSTTRHLSCGK